MASYAWGSGLPVSEIFAWGSGIPVYSDAEVLARDVDETQDKAQAQIDGGDWWDYVDYDVYGDDGDWYEIEIAFDY